MPRLSYKKLLPAPLAIIELTPAERAVTLAARGFRGSDTRLSAVVYAVTRSAAAADLSMAAITSWRRTASAKSGTLCVPWSMSAANAA